MNRVERVIGNAEAWFVQRQPATKALIAAGGLMALVFGAGVLWGLV